MKGTNFTRIAILLLLLSLALSAFAGCDVVRADEQLAETDESAATTAASESETDESAAATSAVSESETASATEEMTEKEEYTLGADYEEMFEILKADDADHKKIMFTTLFKEFYYEAKNSGLYEDVEWDKDAFNVLIKCDYKKAAHADWYRAAFKTDEEFNGAFYDAYSSVFKNGEFTRLSIMPALLVIYSSLEDFKADYEAIKTLCDLGYVTQIHFEYVYSIPPDYTSE